MFLDDDDDDDHYDDLTFNTGFDFSAMDLRSSMPALTATEVRADGRKLDSTEAFEKSLTQDVAGNGFGPGGGGSMGLKNFADQRRAFLLEYRPKAVSPAP